MQDPVVVSSTASSVIGSNALLAAVRSIVLAAGWTVDEYDTSPTIGQETGGHELYFHSTYGGVPTRPYYSLKSLLGNGANHAGLALFMNTGYDVSRRVDNQPGMFVRGKHSIVGEVSRTQVFAGNWDGSGANKNPGDTGMYLTNAWSGSVLSSPVPLLPATELALNCFNGSPVDTVWGFYDVPASGGASFVAVYWYAGNMLNGFCLGHVLYDDYSLTVAAPYDVDGWLCAPLMSRFDEINLLAVPRANSVIGSVTDYATAAHRPQSIIRSRTSGSVTFPPGTATGASLLDCGPVLLSAGRILANDGSATGANSLVVRPDQGFNALTNNVQSPDVPNPKLSIHRETFGVQNRLGFARPRSVGRWPDGGALSGSYALGQGTVDWADDGHFLPFYVACTLGESAGNVVTNGSRSFLVLPGNRGGGDAFASHRAAGIAFRVL